MKLLGISDSMSKTAYVPMDEKFYAILSIHPVSQIYNIWLVSREVVDLSQRMDYETLDLIRVNRTNRFDCSYEEFMEKAYHLWGIKDSWNWKYLHWNPFEGKEVE